MHFRFIFLTLIFLNCGFIYAQISPDKVSSNLVSESVEQVLETKNTIEWHSYKLSKNNKQTLLGKLKLKNSLPDTIFLGKIMGNSKEYFIFLDNAPSKSEYFTYALYLKEDGSIKDVDVLIYRENYGNEIDYPMFRQQFEGKNNPNNLVFGRTIQNITGATISARSVTYAVKDLLTIFKAIQDNE